MNYRLTLISAILIVCALCSTPSFAEVVEINGYHYDINKEEKVATLVRYTGSSSSVVIQDLFNIIVYMSKLRMIMKAKENIFMDTCIYQEGQFFVSGKLKTLFDAAKEGRICILLPDITEREVLAHIEDKLNDEHEKLKKHCSRNLISKRP